MSILSLKPANEHGNRNASGYADGNRTASGRVEPMPPTYPPRPVPVKKPAPETAQAQLGNVTLEAVDRLTGMTADEIDRVAEQLLDGAQETEAILRELSWRVRENGLFANERLARFVRVANQCADIARSMQECVERRDEEPPPEPKKVEPEAGPELLQADEAADAPAHGAIEQQLEKKAKNIRRRVAR